jgi:hypothetical protein
MQVSQGAIIRGFDGNSSSETSSVTSHGTSSGLRYYFGASVKPAQVKIYSGRVFDGMKMECIEPKSPAEIAGFVVGDTVTLIDRKWVSSGTEWDRVVNQLSSGRVLVHYVRNDRVVDTWVDLKPN